MFNWKKLVLVCVGILVLAGCSRSSTNKITLAGSTAFQPFAEKLAEKYMVDHPELRINVQGGGSAVGIQSALTGAAEIGMADLLTLPDEASSLEVTIIARDGIAIVVHPENPVTNISPHQALQIFAGRITNWKDVGGSDFNIRVISREEGSGTRRTFDKLVLDGEKLIPSALFQNSNGTIKEAVANDRGAIGYLSISLVDKRIKALQFGGVVPTNDNVKKSNYKLARPIYFLTKNSSNPTVKAFIDYVLSNEAQMILEKDGLIAAK